MLRLSIQRVLPAQAFLVALTVCAQQPDPAVDGSGEVAAPPASISSDAPLRSLTGGDASCLSAAVYIVSSVSDSGSGSLRKALEDANRDCDHYDVSCQILFQIPPPVPETGWFTIRLSSPLPPITAKNLSLDGKSQTGLTGDTNPTGPEVFLDGELLEAGNGLDVRSPGDFQVSGLVIGGFPENGILFDAPERGSRSSSYLVADNYIGTDPTGTAAAPNQLRGIAVFLEPLVLLPPTVQAVANLTIRSNIISGNGRSGIFVHSGQFLFFSENRIGVKATTGEPLPNGASGIYFGVASRDGCVDHNVIAHNTHFGIALEKEVPNVWIAQNSITGNGLYGLDIGLDLATPGGTDNVVGRPVLTSARFDERTGTTTISGRFPELPPGLHTQTVDFVDLYSNTALDPKGGGETWLGDVRRGSQADFAFTFQGNLLGQTITATMTRTAYAGLIRPSPSPESAAGLPLCQQQGFHQQTSEFSEAILVTDYQPLGETTLHAH